MNSTAAPSSRCKARSRRRISRCTVTSSAVVGSSATISFGLQAKAMAINTRCRMPPDNSCGYCDSTCKGWRICTAASRSAERSRACCGSSFRCSRSTSPSCRAIVCAGFSAVCGSCGISATSRPRCGRRAGSGSASQSCPSSCTWPAKTRIPAGKMPSTVRDTMLLPAPDSPTSACTSPARMSRSTPRSSSRAGVPRRAGRPTCRCSICNTRSFMALDTEFTCAAPGRATRAARRPAH